MAITAIGITAFAAAPANAYGTLSIRYALVDTGTCARLAGNLTVVDQGNGCFLNDSVDDTFFEKDAGGVAVKFELRDGAGLVSKVEFHPYGEKLWVYDTRNDGDTVYAQTQWGDYPRFAVGAPGTDATIDQTVFDDECPDGQSYVVRLYDGVDGNWGTDYITQQIGRC